MMRFNKFLIHFIILIFFPFASQGQASSSSNFELTVSFESDIPVQDIDVSYYKTSGNFFDEISYRVDSINNSIVLSGRNSYILWVSFPTLVFSLEKKIIDFRNKDKVGIQTFYLISEGSLSSYTGKQTKKICFKNNTAAIRCSLEFHSYDDAYDCLKLDIIETYIGESFNVNLTNELISIEER